LVNLERFQTFACDHRLWTNFLALGMALALGVLAYRSRQRSGRASLFLAGMSLSLGLAFSVDDFLHLWDERFHALVGLHLAQHPWLPTLWETQLHPAPLDWEHAHVWLHKPPFALWMIALSLKLLGTSELAVRLPSLLGLAGMTVAVFRLGRRLFNEEVAMVAALLAGTNAQLLDLASGRQATDHPESLYASLVCFAVLAAVCHVDALEGKRQGPGRLSSATSSTRVATLWAILAGGLTGLAVLTKWLPALVVFLVWGAYVDWRPRRSSDKSDAAEADTRWRSLWEILLGAGVCGLVVLPWQLWIFHAFPTEARYEATHAWSHLGNAVEGQGGPFYYHLIRIRRFFGEASPPALVWFFAKYRLRTRAARLLGVWLGVVYLFFSLIHTRMPNFTMMASPAVFLILGAAITKLVAAFSLEALQLRWRRLALAALLVLTLLPIRYLFERWKPWRREFPERAWAAELRRLRPAAGVAPVARFGESHSVEAMFYTGGVAYAEEARPEDLAEAERRGFQVVRSPR
jgi:4-amino-4-deoxy-L-arabinose transferase